MNKNINIAILGMGTVGKGIFRILTENEKNIRARLEKRYEKVSYPVIRKVLVRDMKKHGEIPESILTSDFNEILNDEDIDIVIEVMGGETPASEYMKKAMEHGKHVITANKLALFRAQGELEEYAINCGVYLGYEAAAAGAMPVIRSINESFITDEISSVRGIINGSTNFILTEVSEGKKLSDAVNHAYELGYLEADPSLDLDGYDAMFKAGILAYLISGRYPKEDEIERAGISQIDEEMIREAEKSGKRIKLIAEILKEQGRVITSVKPQLIDRNDPLYNVSGSLNAVSIKLDYAKDLFIEGRGAGSTETATAVLSDVFYCINSVMRK